MATFTANSIAGNASDSANPGSKSEQADSADVAVSVASVNARDELGTIGDLVRDGLNAVDGQIEARLQSDVALIRTLGQYIIKSGGKRLRPLALLLSARASGHEDAEKPALLGAVIEFIHTATLLHDDVVDESALRRGKATANDVWGNASSVLVGDFLYSRAFQMMVEADSLRVMDVMAETTNAIAEGEVMQLLNAHSADLTETQYMETIKRKTARLFESSARLGAIIAQADSSTEEALAQYGLHLGNAFQLIDDALDYHADIDEIGKNLGDDLAEGKATLPIIETMRRGNAEQEKLVGDAIKNGDREAFKEVFKAIETTGALSYTFERAREEAEAAKQALSTISNSKYRQGMTRLADFAVERTF